MRFLFGNPAIIAFCLRPVALRHRFSTALPFTLINNYSNGPSKIYSFSMRADHLNMLGFCYGSIFINVGKLKIQTQFGSLECLLKDGHALSAALKHRQLLSPFKTIFVIDCEESP
jgi:hypothetical protein